MHSGPALYLCMYQHLCEVLAHAAFCCSVKLSPMPMLPIWGGILSTPDLHPAYEVIRGIPGSPLRLAVGGGSSSRGERGGHPILCSGAVWVTELKLGPAQSAGSKIDDPPKCHFEHFQGKSFPSEQNAGWKILPSLGGPRYPPPRSVRTPLRPRGVPLPSRGSTPE